MKQEQQDKLMSDRHKEIHATKYFKRFFSDGKFRTIQITKDNMLGEMLDDAVGEGEENVNTHI